MHADSNKHRSSWTSFTLWIFGRNKKCVFHPARSVVLGGSAPFSLNTFFWCSIMSLHHQNVMITSNVINRPSCPQGFKRSVLAPTSFTYTLYKVSSRQDFMLACLSGYYANPHCCLEKPFHPNTSCFTADQCFVWHSSESPILQN